MELWKRRILTNEDISRIVVRESFPPSDGAAINFELFSFFFFLYSVEGTKKPFF